LHHIDLRKCQVSEYNSYAQTLTLVDFKLIFV